MSPAPPLPARVPAAFTLVEVMIAATMLAVVIVAALTGVTTLQKSYAATEQYATGMADQMRLLDYLAQDLRRAVAAPVTDADGQGIRITVPNYYRFNSSDKQHLFPVVNDAKVNGDGTAAAYADPANPEVTTQTVAYRFKDGSVTRLDPWQPLIPSAFDKSAYVSAGAVVIASNMEAFPTITPDKSDTTGAILRYNVTFHSIFQPFATSNQANAVTLHNVTFVRSKNLTR